MVLTAKGNAESWDLSGHILKENILPLNGASFVGFISSLIRQIFVLRHAQVDLVIDLEKFSRISSLISFASNAKKIAGFYRYEYEGLYRGKNLLDIPCSFNQNMHISRNFLALVKSAFQEKQNYPNFKDSINIEDLILQKFIPNQLRGRELRDNLGFKESDQLILINPDVGSNLQVRNYPIENYAQVGDELIKLNPRIHIIIIGVRENLEICNHLEKAISSQRCHNLCGKTDSLRELMELFCISELLIGNDNGPLHFASLASIKILGLFSTDSPYVYGPLGDCVVLYSFFHCSPCVSALNHKHSRCKENLCLRAIPPAQVVQIALRLMDNLLPLRTINGLHTYLNEVTSVAVSSKINNLNLKSIEKSFSVET